MPHWRSSEVCSPLQTYAAMLRSAGHGKGIDAGVAVGADLQMHPVPGTTRAVGNGQNLTADNMNEMTLR
jgi:hypothetical protein